MLNFTQPIATVEPLPSSSPSYKNAPGPDDDVEEPDDESLYLDDLIASSVHAPAIQSATPTVGASAFMDHVQFLKEASAVRIDLLLTCS